MTQTDKHCVVSMRQVKLITICIVSVVSLAAATLVVVAADSLHWRYQHDSPLMIYAGFLVANGLVPYRDFFDMNVPGVYLIMAAVGALGGWDDLPFRVFDLVCLATISVSTFSWMRRFGKLPAFAGAVAFPISYLTSGPIMSLQREYIALVPLALALAITLAPSDANPISKRRIFLVGFLVGVSSLVKPQFLIFSLPFLFLHIRLGVVLGDRPSRVASYLTGILLPICAVMLYLVCTGGFIPFIDTAIGYWPLYTSMTGDHRIVAGLSRLIYIVEQNARGLLKFSVPMAVIGLIAISKSHHRYAWFLGSLVVLSALYPSIAGQFWFYHWLPLRYIALSVGLLSICMLQSKDKAYNDIALISVALLVALLLLSPSYISFIRIQSRIYLPPPKAGVPDEIAAFLRSHMRPGDTVQPLDWTGGAVHGMLMAKAPLATKFMYDFHFYHHVSHPYIQRLRSEFINEINAKKPRFIVQILQDKPWPVGQDTTQEFPALQAFLERYYVSVQESARYRILQRKD